jgi:hypothetical protein
MCPTRGAFFNHCEQFIHRHRTDHDQSGKGERHLHRRTGRDEQLADAFIGRIHFRHGRTDEGQRDRDLAAGRRLEVGGQFRTFFLYTIWRSGNVDRPIAVHLLRCRTVIGRYKLI